MSKKRNYKTCVNVNKKKLVFKEVNIKKTKQLDLDEEDRILTMKNAGICY